GQGSLGQLVNNPSAYEHLNRTAENFQDVGEALKHNFLLRGFFKHRGYENQSDLKRNATSSLPAGPPAQRFDIPGKDLFEKKKHAEVEHGKLLDEAGNYLRSHPFSLVVVAAEAGMEGDTATQQKLTEARAYAARQWLVDHFPLADTRIKTIGLGKSPDAPPGGEVSILVYGGTGAAPTGAADR